MTKRSDGSQLDLDLAGSQSRSEVQTPASSARVLPFVDAATLKIRRDALRRLTATGIFQVPSSSRTT